MKFDTYFTMSEEQAVAYAKSKLNFIFNQEAELECKEIGDGNLNYIFKIWDKVSGKSIIVKQSGPVARISDEFTLSPDRNRIEFEILKYEGELAPGLVPQVYMYDPIMNCTVMDDLSDHQIMRTALMQFKKFPLFSEHISEFMVNTLLLTTDVVLEHKQKKELVKNFINPELCEISEDLVFTEPFSNNKSRNDVFAPNKEWVEEHLYHDHQLRLETAIMKFEFMNHAQSLIHGDLHTGSIFIKEDSTKIIDPEFAFFGPMGYDVGNVIANLMFAWANSDANGQLDHKLWLEETIVDVVDKFLVKFSIAWDQHVSEYTAKYEGFKEYYISSILRDTAGVVGLEGIRRIVGLAHVKDITTIRDEAARVRAERICMTASKRFIMNRSSFSSGREFLAVIKEAENLF
ncbi:MAG: S-methyl-5-thioribose kinase [Erysipelothrix sp.]|jgi:5-methylthioribose kinase|nr:S-methyl-5-thioribose kinase [Erysipelothrix sp.]